MRKYRIRTLLVATTLFIFSIFVYATIVQNGSMYILGTVFALLIAAIWGSPIINFEEMEDNIDSENCFV